MVRQQTLAASIDWSHDLLDETDQVVFRRLAAFSGAFSLDAARAVCGAAPLSETEVLVALGRLVDKSLVVMEERAGEARHRLLETIRQYATDRLDEAGETVLARDRHLDHFVAVAEVAEPGLVDVDQDTWLARFEADHDNLRAALDWGLAQDDAARARRLASVLIWLWYLRGHTNEGIDFLQRAIARAPDERSPLQSLLLAGVSAVSVASGQFDVLVDYAQQALGLSSATLRHLGQSGEAAAVAERGLAVARTAMGYVRADVAEPDRQATLAERRKDLGDDAFAAVWSAGAVLSLDEAVALVRRTRGTRRRPTTGWGSLTLTELDVARCIGDGLSNPDIAERLFMGRGTVKTHLSHIYAKLDITNRTELATLATRQLGDAQA